MFWLNELWASKDNLFDKNARLEKTFFQKSSGFWRSLFKTSFPILLKKNVKVDFSQFTELFR